MKYMDTLPAQVEQPPEKVWITVQFVVGIFMTFVAFQGFLAAYKESRRQHFYMSAVVVLISWASRIPAGRVRFETLRASTVRVRCSFA